MIAMALPHTARVGAAWHFAVGASNWLVFVFHAWPGAKLCMFWCCVGPGAEDSEVLQSKGELTDDEMVAFTDDAVRKTAARVDAVVHRVEVNGDPGELVRIVNERQWMAMAPNPEAQA